MLYEWIKVLHIISASVLFGTGLGSALYMLVANFRQDIEVIALANKRVVIADWYFTSTSGFLQAFTGLFMLHLKDYSLLSKWSISVFSCYLIAGFCWIIVVYLQIRCRDLAILSYKNKTPLSKKYRQYFIFWIILGIPAFTALIIVLFLMSNSPFST